MKKISQLLYLVVALVVVSVTTFALISGGKKDKIVAENYQPLAGAKASSYEPFAGTLEVKADDNIIGSDKASLKVFVYEDYSSKYSSELAETLNKIFLEADNQLMIIVRPYALSSSIISRETALATMCAKDLGKWETMRTFLLAAVKDGALSDVGFSGYANAIQVNEDEFKACLTNEEKSVKLDELMLNAKEQLVLGAPTIIVGNDMILGARPYADYVDSNGDSIEGLKTVIMKKLGELSKRN
jgi:protein-disulfide isomerase